MNKLFSPINIGGLELPNRIVMAPLTRNRAGDGNVAREMNVIYYSQRASAGLIVTEATQISPQGVGYPKTPGIHSEEQVAGWRKVTDSVHKQNGRIFLQLWHVGRISHPTLQPDGALPVAPSAIRPEGVAMTYEGPKPFETPRELAAAEIPMIIEQYRLAARNAKRAGFDGVEIHGANGYLIDQFLRDGSNKRTDQWGGAVENRAKFALEVVKAVCEEWPSNRVGIRLSPYGDFNSMSDSNLKSTFGYLIDKLNDFPLAYVHIIEALSEADKLNIPKAPPMYFRSLYRGLLMLNAGYTLERASQMLSENTADLISFGRMFISNPDLPHRLKKGLPLANPDSKTFYGGNEKGYIDYPPAETTTAP